jgi:hypothetical protein
MTKLLVKANGQRFYVPFDPQIVAKVVNHDFEYDENTHATWRKEVKYGNGKFVASASFAFEEDFGVTVDVDVWYLFGDYWFRYHGIDSIYGYSSIPDTHILNVCLNIRDYFFYMIDFGVIHDNIRSKSLINVELDKIVNRLKNGQVISINNGKKMIMYSEDGVVYRFGFINRKWQISMLVGLIEICVPVSSLSFLKSTKQTLLTLKKLTI